MEVKDDQEAYENDTEDSRNDKNPNEGEDDDSSSSDDVESIVQEDEITSSVDMERKKKKALLELRFRLEDAILGDYLLGKPKKNTFQEEIANQKVMPRDITLWDVPLLPSKGHQGTDVLLLKFLKARDFNVQEAFEMLSKTLKWRNEYAADKILEEKLDSDIRNVLYLMGRDREGRPLCYNVYGALKDREFYNKTLGSEDKCNEFLRWRVRCMEKGIKKLDFENGGVDSIVQITDLKNSPGPSMKELRSVSKRALNLLQNNYPGFIHKNVVINAPFWYYATHVLRSRFLSQKARRKFVFARPSKVKKTLLKYVGPENLPVQYGGFNRDNDEDFSPAQKASELPLKANSTASVEFPVAKAGSTLVWDITVAGSDVSYKEEFIPDDEGSYKIQLQKQKKLGESVRNSFYISEPGKLVITFHNGSFKKKRVHYRSKAKPTVPMYIFYKST